METEVVEKTVEEKEVSNGITIVDLFYIIKKHLIAICLIVAVCLGFGAVYTKVIATPQYQSSATMLISVAEKRFHTGEDANGDPTYSILTPTAALMYANQLKESLISFTQTRRVRLEVLKNIQTQIKELDNQELYNKILNYLPEIDTIDYTIYEDDTVNDTAALNKISRHLNTLLGGIAYQSTDEEDYNLLLNITYVSSDPEISRYILNAYLNTVVDMSLLEDENGVKLFPDIYQTLHLVDLATLGSRQSRTVRNLAIALVFGLVIAVCYTLIREISEDKFKSKKDVERILKKPVLAVIPNYQTTEDDQHE